MILKRIIPAVVAAIVAMTAVASANYIIKDGNGNFQGVCAFICQVTQICPAQVIIDSMGNEKATAANPLVDNIAQIAGNPIPTGVGASTTGSPRMAVARDSQIQIWDGVTPTAVATASTAPTAGQPALVITQSPNGDPCAVPTIQRSNVVINITTAATTQLVALSTSKVVYICGFSVSLPTSGTSAATFTLEYGTGTNCATGTTALTGAFGAGYTTAGPPINYASGPANGTVASAPASNALCVLTAGTTVNLQGHLTYVQQ